MGVSVGVWVSVGVGVNVLLGTRVGVGVGVNVALGIDVGVGVKVPVAGEVLMGGTGVMVYVPVGTRVRVAVTTGRWGTNNSRPILIIVE